jgi:hypothetical protein
VIDACLINGFGTQVAPGTWEKKYVSSDGYRAAYRSTVLGSSGRFLYVDDSDATYARVMGYESMSSIDDGTDRFPLESQVSGGQYFVKRADANPTPVKWRVFVNSTMFYLVTTAGAEWDNSTVRGGQLVFGEMNSFDPVDTYKTLMWCAADTGTGVYGALSHWVSSTGYPNKVIVRGGASKATQSVYAFQAFYVAPDFSRTGMYGSFAYPIESGGMLVFPYPVWEYYSSLWNWRGVLPGCYVPLHGLAAITDGTTQIDSRGRTLFSCHLPGGNNVSSQVVFDLTGPWS